LPAFNDGSIGIFGLDYIAWQGRPNPAQSMAITGGGFKDRLTFNRSKGGVQ